MSSADHTVAQTDGVAAVPVPERLPRLRDAFVEQLRPSTFFLGQPKRGLVTAVAAIMLYAAILAHLRRGRLLPGLTEAERTTVIEPLSFFPDVVWYAIWAGTLGFVVWHRVRKAFAYGLPLDRQRHILIRTAALWVNAMALVMLTLMAGGLYAALMGAPDRYLVELVAYFPVPFVGATIVFLLAAAFTLRSGTPEWGTPGWLWWWWSGVLFATAFLYTVVEQLPQPLQSVREHLLFVFGAVPSEGTGITPGTTGFPYATWIPLALLWLVASFAALFWAASRYEEMS